MDERKSEMPYVDPRAGKGYVSLNNTLNDLHKLTLTLKEFEIEKNKSFQDIKEALAPILADLSFIYALEKYEGFSNPIYDQAKLDRIDKIFKGIDNILKKDNITIYKKLQFANQARDVLEIKLTTTLEDLPGTKRREKLIRNFYENMFNEINDPTKINETLGQIGLYTQLKKCIDYTDELRSYIHEQLGSVDKKLAEKTMETIRDFLYKPLDESLEKQKKISETLQHFEVQKAQLFKKLKTKNSEPLDKVIDAFQKGKEHKDEYKAAGSSLFKSVVDSGATSETAADVSVSGAPKYGKRKEGKE